MLPGVQPAGPAADVLADGPGWPLAVRVAEEGADGAPPDADAVGDGVLPGHALPYAADGSVSPDRSAAAGLPAAGADPPLANSHASTASTTSVPLRMRNRRRQ